MIIFYQGSPKTLSMYCKIIEEVCREPLGEILVEKNGGKTKWKGDKVFIEPLAGVEICQGSVENPLRVLL
jgi:hypothetical protein